MTMAAPRNVAVLVGSLRKESLNRKMANALIRLAPAELSLRIVEIGALPLYNADHEADPPPAVTEFKEAIAKSDAVLFVTPEYNRSMPGVLKNAIDVGSRPSGKSAWMGKPAAIVSVSPGAIGGFGANHNVRQSHRLPEHAGDAHAGGLHRRRGQSLRRRRLDHHRQHA